MKNIIISTLLLLFAFVTGAQQVVVVDNENPRKTVEGKIVDAHDGRIIQFQKKFYWYGTSYKGTNGFTNANEYVCYSSTDLKQWTFEGPLLEKKSIGVYYRPHIVYNSRTKLYVLWYNWYPKLWQGQFGVATSQSPTGPFTILNENVPMKHSKLGVGDLGLFVNEDNKAYISYNTINNHKVSVELLDEDYTKSTLTGSEFIAEHCEAGSMFKKDGTYYLLSDYTCCFCTQGSGAKVFTAKNPLGPYVYRQNINRYPGNVSPVLNDGFVNDNLFENLQAKPKTAIEIWLNKSTNLNSLVIHQFTGNRNGQCGEVDNPILHQSILKHAFTIKLWKDGEWKIVQPTSATTHSSSMLNNYRFSFKTINTGRVLIEPAFADSSQPVQIAEVIINNAKIIGRVFLTDDLLGKPIIPAQQTYVMPLSGLKGTQFIWMGDLWGSASDGVKGHDYQFWSKPLEFYKNGLIKPLEWINQFQITLKN